MFRMSRVQRGQKAGCIGDDKDHAADPEPEPVSRRTASATVSRTSDLGSVRPGPSKVRENSGSSQAQWLSLLESTAAAGVESQATDLKLVALGSGYPNPAGAKTHISYSMPYRGLAMLRMVDVSGRAVRTLVDGDVGAGTHEATWDGRDDRGRSLPAGMYWYELNANGTRLARSMVRLP